MVDVYHVEDTLRGIASELRQLGRRLDAEAVAAEGEIREAPREDMVKIAQRLVSMSERINDLRGRL
jgi:hypothetical protein